MTVTVAGARSVMPYLRLETERAVRSGRNVLFWCYGRCPPRQNWFGTARPRLLIANCRGMHDWTPHTVGEKKKK